MSSFPRRKPTRPIRRAISLALEPLEQRKLLSGSVAEHALPLSSVPILSSNPNAAHKIYLDFLGEPAQSWGGYSVTETPAYDQDGDATTFSTGELSSINEIWQRVAEKYSPFDIDVTTLDPGNITNGLTLKSVIGGDGAWTGAVSGGITYVNSFTSVDANINFIFPVNLTNGEPLSTAEAAAHEAGHAFGLLHQSLYDESGIKLDTYNHGDALVAPLMGFSYTSQRGLWWNGPSQTSATSIQDDLAILTSGTNGFGYRTDDHSNVVSAPDALTITGSSAAGTGIIERSTDADVFSFFTGPGNISFTANVASFGAMLDLKLSLYDANDNLLTTIDTSALGETLAYNVLTADTYKIAVASHGGYGDLGQYSLFGSIFPFVPINAPTDLTATPSSPQQIALQWDDNSESERGFRIERSTDGTNFNEINTVGSDTTSYLDSGRSPGTSYWYRVRAYDNFSPSGYSNTASTVTPLVPPAAPTNLAATGVSPSAIDVSWVDASNNEAGFKLARSPDNVTWLEIASLGTDVASYQDTGLSEATTYYYRVYAHNSGGASSTTPAVAGATLLGLPAAPSSLTASADTQTHIALVWADNSTTESGFQLERSPDGNTGWTTIATLAANTTTYDDNGLSAATTYHYRVAAVNIAGPSGYSNVASAKTRNATAPALAPTAPTGLDAVAISPSQVNLEWNDVSNNETGFHIERTIAGQGNWTRIGSAPLGSGTYEDTTVSAGTNYAYRVQAYNSVGASAFAGPTQVETPIPSPTPEDPPTPPTPTPTPTPTAPAAPSALAASAISSSQIDLSWTDNSSDETGFVIEQSSDGVNWTIIHTAAAGATSHSVQGLSANTTYHFRVRATNAVGDSANTDAASATTLAPDAYVVTLDNAADSGITGTGVWYRSTMVSGYTGADYFQDGKTGKGKQLRFSPTLAHSGTYNVYLRWTAGTNRAKNTPVDVTSVAGTNTIKVDQRTHGGEWVLLGTYNFDPTSTYAPSVTIRTAGTGGFVTADAVQFVEVAADPSLSTPRKGYKKKPALFKNRLQIRPASVLSSGGKARYADDPQASTTTGKNKKGMFNTTHAIESLP